MNAKLQQGRQKARERAKDPFLTQRYAYQLLRLRLSAADRAQVVAFHDQNAAALEAPSNSLTWRALVPSGGAARRGPARPGAPRARARELNLPPLAGPVANALRSQSDADWKGGESRSPRALRTSSRCGGSWACVSPEPWA